MEAPWQCDSGLAEGRPLSSWARVELVRRNRAVIGFIGIKNRRSRDIGRDFCGDARERDEHRISAVLRTTTQNVLSETLTINDGRLRFSRRRVTYPRPLSTQVFAARRFKTQKVEATGIALASLILQVVSQHDTCVDYGCQWLHYVCAEEALPGLVAAWHGLAPEVREKIVALWCGLLRVRGASSSCFGLRPHPLPVPPV
jgi:hypothetical protein